VRGRLHSACGDIPPAEFEEAYHRQLEANAAASFLRPESPGFPGRTSRAVNPQKTRDFFASPTLRRVTMATGNLPPYVADPFVAIRPQANIRCRTQGGFN
jgi:hypothetical protein